MATIRRDQVFDAWTKLRSKKCISMDELDELMYAIEKLLMNYDQTVEGRDEWKRKYKELKNAE